MEICASPSFLLGASTSGDKSIMKCSKCGSEIDEGVSFCPHCGFKLDVNIDILNIKIDDFKDKSKQGWILSLLGCAVFLSGLWSIFEFTSIRYELQEWTIYEIIHSLFRKPITIIPLLGIVFLLTGIIGSIYYTYKREELIRQLE